MRRLNSLKGKLNFNPNQRRLCAVPEKHPQRWPAKAELQSVQ